MHRPLSLFSYLHSGRRTLGSCQVKTHVHIQRPKLTLFVNLTKLGENKMQNNSAKEEQYEDIPE